MVWCKLLPLAGNVASFLWVTDSFVHNLRRCYRFEGCFSGVPVGHDVGWMARRLVILVPEMSQETHGQG